MKKLFLVIALVLLVLATVDCSWYQTKDGRDTLAQASYWGEGGGHNFIACGSRQPDESRAKFRARIQNEAVGKLLAAGKRLENQNGIQFFPSSSYREACAAAHELGYGYYALEALRPPGQP